MDAQRFRQVINNLISNAIKYSEEGSVIISAECNLVNGKGVINVLDTGIGIPENMQDAIFSPYEQVNANHGLTRNIAGADRVALGKIGTGLGLSIARRLAQLMGGDVELVESGPAGSKFSFSFKVNLASDAEIEKEIGRNSGQAWKDKMALVVDDSSASACVAREYLSRLGLHAQVASSGQAALDRMKNQAFDYVFLDSTLPDISGTEVLKMAQPSRAHFIAYTGYVGKEVEDEFARLGFQGHLGKPASYEDFRNVLLRVSQDELANV